MKMKHNRKDLKKSIFYFMHIPWRWIKQRPHFIAEGLCSQYRVNVFIKKSYTREDYITNETSLQLAEFFRLPYERLGLLNKVNRILIQTQIRKILHKYDVIWLTSPRLFQYFDERMLEDKLLIYDCMDDVLEFPSIASKGEKNEIFENERRLVERSNLVIASSRYLSEKLITRFETSKDIKIVNNAVNFCECVKPEGGHLGTTFSKQFAKSLVYIGTISSWLDKKLIYESLVKFEDIEYYFYGPVAGEILSHPRIRYMGKIDHDLVSSAMKQADALVMPFIVNELILAVNPVKLYEYVSSGKPVISVHYPEVNQFEDYVHLYKNKQEYFLFLEKLTTNKLSPKMSLEDCQEFARNNTWAKRVKRVSEYIEEL